MAKIASLQTNTLDYTSLIGNNKIYHVPRFQRDYSWSEEEWEDLWMDIRNLGEEDVHYMGYIVLQRKEGDTYEIIDGQQRLATLSILALAVVKRLEKLVEDGEEPENNRERIGILRQNYIGHKDPSSLTPTSKLFLNRNNDDFYQSYLMRLRAPSNSSRLKPSEKLLWKAFEYFSDKINEDYAGLLEGEWLAGFLSKYIGKKLVFTVIHVDDELSAYKVFETLNARGVRLSPTDLLKNYLFSVIATGSEHDLGEAERQWADINSTLARKDFSTFLRYYWNSCHSLARKKELFKEIRKEVETPDAAFELLGILQELAGFYTALSSPEDSTWKPDQRRYVGELKLFNVRQWYPLLLACIRKSIPGETLSKILKICSMISFRYNIISNLNPNEMEKAYNRAAIRISNGKISSPREVFQELKSIYVIDETFKNNFITKELHTKSGRNRKIVRYILFSLENQIAGKNYDIEDSRATIEHILPENPSSKWEVSFSLEEQENYMYRIGNLSLLERSKNKDCGNNAYDVKFKHYAESQYETTKRYITSDEWNATSVRKRQEKLAKIAVAVWKIQY